MIVQYKPNEMDASILKNVKINLLNSLEKWYGPGATLGAGQPEIRSYKNSFILRYPVTTASGQEKHILVKIRRKPKMVSLSQAIAAPIHQNMDLEYKALKFIHDRFSQSHADFAAIRPLCFMNEYAAIVMEEYPARTLRQLLVEQRHSKSDWATSELRDAARKTGRWLYYFHHHLCIPFEKRYTTEDILNEVRDYAGRIEANSHGRVQSQAILDAFSRKLKHIRIEQVTFSKSHSDMTTDNVLYSDDGKLCLIDLKNRLTPVYVDLGLILTHPETSKPQIFSDGTYYPESLLRKYRAEIIAGYFDEAPGCEVLVRIYSAIMVLNKWLMYEELMSKYRGIKRWLAIPAGPYVSAYFKHLLKKHLGMIAEVPPTQACTETKTPAGTSR